ncbi:MAG: hypothetical protein H7221_10095 [Flavobacterium sp.]|nr:hypothetical protein [Flavobacterium sp.]
MYLFIQKFHSGWAYLVLILLVVTVLNALRGLYSKKEFSASDRKIALFTLIFCHIQLLVGLILYFQSPIGFSLIQSVGISGLDSAARLTAVEHPFTNIIALTLITIGWSRHKKLESNAAKFKSFMIFYGIGLILILSMIPWNIWFK